MRVLVVTSQWPTPEHPYRVPFLVREVRSLRAKGVDVDVFAFGGGFRPANYFREWMRLRWHVRANTYDLVHVQFGQSGLVTIPQKRVPLVVTFHGSDLNGVYNQFGQLTPRGLVLRRVSQVVALFADEVIVVSERLSRFLRKRQYHVIPCGLDLDLFRPIPRDEARAELGLRQDRRFILFAGGTGNPIKRYALARAATEALPAQMQAELLVVEGVTPERIPLYLNAADVLLLTSSREGSPSIVKEALACNLPVVSTDVGDVRERVRGIDGCIVCDDDHPTTIAAALEAVLVRGTPIEGRESVLGLDQSIIAERIIGVYQKALSRRS